LYRHVLHATDTALFFDDIVDLSMVKEGGLRFLISRTGPLAFRDYIVKNHLADYITASYGGQNALREVAEMLMVLKGSFERVIDERTRFSDSYKAYLAARDEVTLSTMKWDKDTFKKY